MKIIRPTTITDAILTSSSIPENDYAAYSGATTYADGDRVISTTTHRIYESLQNANTGNALPVSPAIITAWWQDIGATNRWKMFDGGVATQSQLADEIQVVLQPGRVDSLALLNIDAVSYRVILDEDSGSPSNTVYDTGVVLLEEDQNIGNWYEYFFEPLPLRKSDVVLTDIPPYTNGILRVILRAATATVSLGLLLVGLYREIGDTQWAPTVGITDYSVKSTDSFGNAVVTERPFAKRLSADVFIDNELVDYVVKTLTTYRATPVVWIGDEDFTSTIIYGYFKDFETVIQSPAGSFCNVEIEGLI